MRNHVRLDFLVFVHNFTQVEIIGECLQLTRFVDFSDLGDLRRSSREEDLDEAVLVGAEALTCATNS